MKGLERKIEQYSLPHQKEHKMTVRKCIIDLNKMSEDGRNYYLQDLLLDLAEGLKDLSGEKPRYDYIKHLIDHAEQASKDLKDWRIS